MFISGYANTENVFYCLSVGTLYGTLFIPVSSYAGSEILPDRGTVHKRTVISVMISVTKQIKLRRVDLESVVSHIG